MGLGINDYDLRNAFSLERKLLLLVGFYPRINKDRSYLYHLSAFINLLFSYGQLITMIIQMFLDRNDLSKLTESLLYFFTHFTFLMKLLNFQYYSANLLEIETLLKNSEFYGLSRNQLQLIKKKIRACSFIAFMFRVCCTITCLFFTLVPFIDESRKMTLPLPGWLPYDTTRYYFPSVFAQALSVFISAYCNTSIDILNWKLITLVSAQFEILKENLEKIDYTASFQATNDILVQCIKHHLQIVRLNQQIQNVFSKGVFLQILSSVIVICTTGFQMLVVPIPSVNFMGLVLYFCGMTTQVATYCWHGHDVLTTSDGVGLSFYMSNWYISHKRIRKTALIFMENAKKPIRVTAGDFITLSLPTLMQILRSSYSYFAVLQRLYTKN